MHTPNPQVVHARKCAGSAEDSIARMEIIMTRRLQGQMSTVAEESYIQTLRSPVIRCFQG